MLKQGTSVRFFATMFVAGAALLAASCSDSTRSIESTGSEPLRINRLPGTHQAHDFNDAFYVQNGLDPTSSDFRRRFEIDGVPNGVQSVETATTDPTRSTTRVLPVNCGYDAAGQTLCYPGPPVFFGEKSFMNNAAGDLARELAEFRAFIFPKACGFEDIPGEDCFPLSPMPPNRRQDNLFETTKGYVGANPLGLWRLTFVRYTNQAFTPEGQAVLAPLHVQNGTDLDGTPIIKRLHVLVDLEQQGLVEFTVRPIGVGAEPWVV